MVPTQCGACAHDIVNTRVSALMSAMSGYEALVVGNVMLVSFPPNPTDFTLPKRSWERAMRDTRNDLKQLRETNSWVDSLLSDVNE